MGQFQLTYENKPRPKNKEDFKKNRGRGTEAWLRRDEAGLRPMRPTIVPRIPRMESKRPKGPKRDFEER